MSLETSDSDEHTYDKDRDGICGLISQINFLTDEGERPDDPCDTLLATTARACPIVGIIPRFTIVRARYSGLFILRSRAEPAGRQVSLNHIASIPLWTAPPVAIASCRQTIKKEAQELELRFPRNHSYHKQKGK